MSLTPQQHTIITTDNLQLAAFTYGDNTLPPMVLVHGYPDCSGQLILDSL